MSIVEKIKSYYESNNLRYGKGNPKNLWIEKSRQTIRFNKILSSINLENKTIYDVGCGYGDLFFYLLEKKVDFKEYSGIELLKEHYDVAKEKLPQNIKIDQGDFLEKNVKFFDVVILCGVLNFYEDGWLNFALKVVEKMWALSKKAIVFNIRSRFKNCESENLKPSFWCAYAEKKTNTFSVHHDYLESDFTMVMFKNGGKKDE